MGGPGGEGAMGAGGRPWPDAIMPALVAQCPGMQCKMVGACCYSTCHAVPALVAEVERLRAEVERLRADVASAENCYHWRRNDCTPNDSE